MPVTAIGAGAQLVGLVAVGQDLGQPFGCPELTAVGTAMTTTTKAGRT